MQLVPHQAGVKGNHLFFPLIFLLLVNNLSFNDVFIYMVFSKFCNLNIIYIDLVNNVKHFFMKNFYSNIYSKH